MSCNKMKTSLEILVRQAARWAVAAEQDESPMIAVLHANYAAGYLWALQDIATPAEVVLYTGVDSHQLKKEIVAIQDKCTQRIARLCPGFIGNVGSGWLAAVAGEV